METKNKLSEEEKVNRFIRRKTLIAFAVFFAAFGFGYAGWKWIFSREEENGVLSPFRKVLNANEKINAVFFDEKHMAKEYPKSKAVKKARVNGDIGMGEEFEPATWKLAVAAHPENKADRPFFLTMNDIMALPKRDIVFDFKCIEGWNQITHWGGARFYDFLVKYKLGTHSGSAPNPSHPEDLYKYVGLITPDSAYYVGIDMKSMLHPQTLLCYELSEKPLPYEQGFPLRLIITVKYGVKSLKRIGYIYFSDTRPPDYWFEHGYDYDAAL